MAEFTSTFEQGIPVIKYSGSITTLMQAPMPGFKELIQSGYTKIILDASSVSYINSQGLSSIINTHRYCHKTNVHMVMTGVKPDVMKIIRVARANLFIPIFDDVKTALKEIQYSSGTAIQSKSRETIIIVQRNIPLTVDLEAVLHEAHQSQNYDFVTKTDLNDALEYLNENDGQLVIIEVNYEPKDVEDFVAGLSMSPRHSMIPILVASPKSRYERAFEFILDGVNDYLPHPFDEFETPTRIRNLLELYYISKSGSSESHMSGLRLSRSRRGR
ncbi:STAS domain-containing protein [bacterium]|nr:STAS domain-containing protein [bacterium]